MMNIYLIAGIIVMSVIFTGYVFYNTIITKKWVGKYPNEKDSWRFLFFYYNPLDARAIVPKRLGLGITLNFARPIPKILALIFLLVLILKIFSIL